MAAKTKNKSNEIKLSRVYDAPLKTVWEAWTDPNQAAKWWGPRGFTITTHSKDFKVGGHWNYTMHGPDGVDYPNRTKYLEIEKYSRMVYDHGGNEEREALFRVTVLFSEVKGKTKMEMTMALPTVEAAEQTKEFIKKANGNSTWDRLAEYLEQNASGTEKFVINRSFDAPIEVMYKMFSDPQHLSKWLAPTGMTMSFIKAEIKSGGSSFYSMSNDSGTMKMYGKANYLEVNGKDRLRYTQEFSDENGNLSRHPAAPTWPATMLTVVTLTPEGEDQTRVTLEWQTTGHVTPEELATFIAGRSGMTQGWTGSFDKLEDYLASL